MSRLTHFPIAGPSDNYSAGFEASLKSFQAKSDYYLYQKLRSNIDEMSSQIRKDHKYIENSDLKMRAIKQRLTVLRYTNAEKDKKIKNLEHQIANYVEPKNVDALKARYEELMAYYYKNMRDINSLINRNVDVQKLVTSPNYRIY